MKVSILLRNPRLEKLISVLGENGRTELHAAMGESVQVKTEDHLRALAGTRHATAEKLGAQPTNHLAAAAEKVAQPGALTSDARAAVLTIASPGIGRAFHDVTITPKKQFLTLPLNALAYGHRVGEFAQVQLVRGRQDTVRQDIPVFLLVRSATQKQDRSLLPSNEEFAQAAASGASLFLRSLPS